MNKRNRVVSIAWTDDDKAATEKCRRTAGPFAPSSSYCLLLLIRHSLASVMRGEISLQDLCLKHSEAVAEITAITARRA